MIPLAIDENFNNDILRGALRRSPQLDIVRVQDFGLAGADDPEVLEWAAGEGRVILSHDVKTLGKFAYERVLAGLPMPGVFEVHDTIPTGQVLEDLLLLATCSQKGEWEGQVRFFPLR